MTTLRSAAQQALEAMEKATRFMSDKDYRKLNESIDVLKAALAEPVQEPMAWLTKWANAYDGEAYTEWQKGYDAARSVVKAHLPALAEPTVPSDCTDSHQPLTIERLRDALVASRIIQPAAVEDPDEYDDGVTLFRIEALHRRIT